MNLFKHPKDGREVELSLWAHRMERSKFYAMAMAMERPADMARMDALLLSRHALVLGVHTDRSGLTPQERAQHEGGTDACERVLTNAREAVRTGPTFTELGLEERKKIEAEVFTIPFND